MSFQHPFPIEVVLAVVALVVVDIVVVAVVVERHIALLYRVN